MEHAFRAGATGYLLKPVTRADLEKSVRALGQRVRRILVVDDDPDVLRLLTRLLRAIDSALEIRGVSSGEQALDELRSRAPDLMLLDIVMRGMDGWEVLALKERDARIRDIPVVLISAQDPEEQPLVSPALVATMGRGLTLTELLRCSLGLSALLLEPDRAHDPGLG
jgi:CheY-like chemotaxis protein